MVLAFAVWPLAAAARTILVLGDSLSAAYNIEIQSGWVEQLQRRIDRRQLPYKVVNASISGDTTADGLARLPRLLDTYRPAIVIIELGGNDGLRGLLPKEVKRNLATMVTRARRSGARVLVLGIRLPPNYGTRYIERFQRLYRELARDMRVPLVPFVLEGIATDPDLMQSDGIHPNARAQSRILENVWPKLQPLLSDRHADTRFQSAKS